MKTIELEGISCHLNQTEKFKTTAVTIEICSMLDERKTAAHFLLTYLLSDCCSKFATKEAVQELFDNMYGASFSVNYDPKGKANVIEFSLSIPSERIIGEPLVAKGIEVLSEFVFFPKMKDGYFEDQLFDECREKCIQEIISLNDDPIFYASETAAKKFGSYFGKRTIPGVEEIKLLTNRQVSDAYVELLETARIDLFVLGSFCEEEVMKNVEKYLTRNITNSKIEIMEVNSGQCMEISETRKISQSCMVILYSTGMLYPDELMPAFMIGNGLLGSLPVSLLFRRIREDEGLCYSIYSENLVFDGLLKISVELERADVDKVKVMIDEVIEKIRKGEFSEEELRTVKKMYINSWISSKDHQESLIWDDYRSVLLGREEQIEKMIAVFDTVTKDEVVDAFRNIDKKMTYVLLQEKKK